MSWGFPVGLIFRPVSDRRPSPRWSSPSGAGAAFAGSTGGTGGTTHPQPLHMEQGGGSNGDFVATTSTHRYYIEVPTGVNRLVVELFDADVGAGTNEAQNQRDRAAAAASTRLLASPLQIPAAPSRR
ncbi:MAG: hypothetical protein R2991_05135 [Thermoanaerobaculia bacterium]